MKFKKVAAAISVASVSALLLSGCAPAGAPFACAVSDEASWDDKSFNEAVYNGLEKARDDLGIAIADAESNSAEDFAPNLQAMIDRECGVIFAVGFNLVEAVNAAAAANPEVKFVTVDGFLTGETTNLKPVVYKMQESSYLAGYLAAAYSTTKVIGTYGGLNIPTVTDFMTGFYFGAKKYEADTGTAVTVVGWDPAVPDGGDFIGGFGPNTPESKAIAAAQIQQGADVIFPVGGDQFGAVSEAIAEAGINGVMIGVDKDIALTSPEYAPLVLTSAEKRMTNATYDIIVSLDKGDAFNAEAYVGTLQNGGTGLSPFYDFDSKIPQEVKDRLAELEQGIKDGTVDPLA